jgi:hypothetical protein
VEWCVVGLDRNWAYNPSCKAARPDLLRFGRLDCPVHRRVGGIFFVLEMFFLSG